jgi:hypothetical protein
VVVDAEQHGLQHHPLGEGAFHHQHRRPGEVQLALGIAPDVAAKGEVRQPIRGFRVDDLAIAEELERFVVEPEVPQGPQRPPDAGDHPVPATSR